MSLAPIRTRILIISDTHGRKPLEEEEQYDASGARLQAYSYPLPEADVAIHCGDLTARSRLDEYERTFSMLRALRAPLKLVIPGNHDRALDRAHWSKVVEWKEELGLSGPSIDEVRQVPDKVQAVIEAAAADNVLFLREGTQSIDLPNGAKLSIYASPMTPEYGLWGFQYPPNSYQFKIPEGVDVAITHGPPKDVLDTTARGERAGCPRLFDAIRHSKPKIHCFGHIHEAWGAKLVTWKAGEGGAAHGNSTAAKAIDADKTRWIDSWDLNDTSEDRQAAIQAMYEAKSRSVDLTSEGSLAFQAGNQTLFVNAAIMDIRYRPRQTPWLVDIDLPKTPLDQEDTTTHL